MLAPALLLFGVFVLYPLVGAVRISLTNSTGIGQAQFVGLANYRAMLSDDTFWQAAGTRRCWPWCPSPSAWPSASRWRCCCATASPVAACSGRCSWRPTSSPGSSSRWRAGGCSTRTSASSTASWRGSGLPQPDWQSDGTAAAVSVVLVLLWARTGLAVILYLSALQGIDRDVLEAAELDGASSWQRLKDVVWPLMRPTTFFLTVMMVIETFQVFDIVWVMTKGGPAGSTELLVTYAYSQGFAARREGYGSAIGVVVFVVVLAATVLWWRAQRSSEDDQ